MGCCNHKESKTDRECYIKLKGIRVHLRSNDIDKECRLELTGRLTNKQIERVPKLELHNSSLYCRRVEKFLNNKAYV